MIQVSSAKNVITLPLHLNADDKWQQCFAKLSEFNLKAVFIDVEAGGKPLKEIYRAAGDIPLCFVNRWEWQQPLPQLGVLVDYVAAYMQALKLLFEKGHKRILFAHYHITAPEKYQATLKAAANRTGYEFPSYELEYLGFSENGELMDKEFNRIFGDPKNAPTALLAVSDYIASKIIERAEKINPMAAGIETIGFFNTANSKVPGHEFSSFEIDYVNMWNKAFEMFNDKENSTTIEWIIPKLIWR
jgi:DNA-binding LacI/PurR family transcriptional regulator